MRNKIHPTAIISKKVKLAKDIEVGPYSVIEDNVSIAAGTKIASHCVIYKNTTIGKQCHIFSSAVLGSQPQDLKYQGAKSFLEIGDNNVIREFCMLNPGTEEGSKTIIGNHNLFMAYSHVAHDCKIGNHCIFANGATLAGHIIVEDYAVISGLVAVHQFARIGKFSIVGGCSKVVQDIPPFSTCDGHPARLYGLNLVGLKRNGMPKESIRKLSRAFKILFNSKLSMKRAIGKVKKEIRSNSEVAYLLNFLKNSPRGVVRSCRSQ